jgi:predicted RNA-binding Zn-ribbon protein involved in translation (DUF1610 family)
MKFLLATALVIGFAGQPGQALAYACNNNYYVNSSGHLVHSPSCGEEHQKRTAECRDGSVSFSEHRADPHLVAFGYNSKHLVQLTSTASP